MVKTTKLIFQEHIPKERQSIFKNVIQTTDPVSKTVKQIEISKTKRFQGKFMVDEKVKRD